ncbi:MAG: FAD-dependent oxidoreductase, partial [Tepidisphaeraceae bacterium]
IFCGGPWSGKLLNDLGVKLTVTRQVMGWVWPPADVLDELRLGRLPVWGIEADGGLFYGFPMTPGEGVGFKSALHAPGQVTDPDGVAREPMSGDEEQFRGPLRRFLPRCDGSVTSMRVCLYTNSPDSDFIIDRHPLHERVTIACGFSGHGFKFASVVGEVLADLTTESGTRHPVGFLGLDRFGGSDIPV